MDPALVEWSKYLRCDVKDLATEGRVLLFESSELQSVALGGGSKKRKDAHILICSDVLVLSQLKKRSTFSRKKPELRYIPTSGLDVSLNKGEYSVQFADVQIVCAKEEVFKQIVENLKKATSVTDPAVYIEEEATAIPQSESKDDRINTIPSRNSGSEDSTFVCGVKTSSVFERMSMWVGEGDAAGNNDLSKEQVQCIKVFKEIVETEQMYVQDLSRLVTEYIDPLKAEKTSDRKPLMSSEDIATLFNSVESIKKANTELLHGLQVGILEISRNGEIPSVCQVAGVFAKAFLRVMPFFKMYSMYCHQYTSSLERLSTLQANNKELASFLQRIEARKKNRQSSLQSLLIKPVQRICKYPLLFRELLTHMQKVELANSDDTGFKQYVLELSTAEATVQEIASAVNKKVSEAENQDHVMQVYLELGGCTGCSGLVTPSRRFVRSEDILMREAPFAENKRQRFRMYLFNDLIIFARIQNGGTLGKSSKLGEKLIGTLTLKKSNLRVTHNFDLDQCKGVRELAYADQEGRQPFELRRVFRNDRSAKSGSAGTAGVCSNGTRTATQIQKFEVWCENKSVSDALVKDIQDALVTLEKNQETRDVAGGHNRGKARAWASRTRTQTWRSATRKELANAKAEFRKESSNQAAESEETTSACASGSATEELATENKALLRSTKSDFVTGSSVETLHKREASVEQTQISLAELKTRYEAAPREKPTEKNGGTIELEIEFPAGPLGLALENSKTPKGVLVACVAALSVAERGGLALGDRVVSVGGNMLPEDTTWDQVVNIIKTLPRPLKICFERTSETMAVGRAKQGRGSRKGRKSGSLGSHSSTEGEDNKGRQRQWVTNMNKRKASHGTSRLLSLQELESCYSNAGSAVSVTSETIETVFKELETKAQTSSTEKSILKSIAVLREIFDTECSYVCDLRKLIGDYMLPLRQARKKNNTTLLETEDEQAIFLNVEGIVRINAELLQNIRSGLTSLSANNLSLDTAIQVVAKEFLVLVPFFKVYATYCHKYTSSLSTLISLRQSNKVLDEFLKQREDRTENKHASLQSLLIKPVQRICKYPLLMKSLCEASQGVVCAATYGELEKITVATQDVASQVNQKVDDAGNMDKVLFVYEQFAGEPECSDLVLPHRRFVSQDDVHVFKAPFSEGKPEARTIFLFNDLIFLAEKLTKSKRLSANLTNPMRSPAVGEGFKLIAKIDLRKCDVRAIGNPANTFQLTQVTRKNTAGKSGGTLSSRVTTCIEKYKVVCGTKAVCDRLLPAISKEIETLFEQDTSKCSSNTESLKKRESFRRNGSRTWNTKNYGTLKQISLEDV
eukprot:CAMPEP_0203753816 /NCGR_PEP_ID=MMETSP0098-20131031/7520_1 /ASSEMBLY_ACC=CAM_ASM_000208 /TAXON_ID=96639 /ORGANISM=" , Strain NY0313808BC1" /LENGTH=1317 /DNA_ID=CAMNT_0050644583 /DNA_START=593 /DNA_END=4543 /DNA_ORIENTATION=-